MSRISSSPWAVGRLAICAILLWHTSGVFSDPDQEEESRRRPDPRPDHRPVCDHQVDICGWHNQINPWEPKTAGNSEQFILGSCKCPSYQVCAKGRHDGQHYIRPFVCKDLADLKPGETTQESLSHLRIDVLTPDRTAVYVNGQPVNRS